jgi:hypothetical protein
MRSTSPAPHFIVALVVALSTWTGPASADEPSNHDKGVATFKEARALIDRGDCKGAILKLDESLSYEASIGAHLSRAECSPDDPLVAWQHLKEAEVLAFAKNDHRSVIARDRAAALEPQLALVRIEMPASTLASPGLEVRIDGHLVDRFYVQGGPMAVKPGKHTVAVAVAVSGKQWQAMADAVVGATASLVVTLQDEPPSAGRDSTATESRKEPLPEQPPSSSQRPWGLILGGVGVASLVVGSVTGAISLADANSAKDNCGGRYPMCSNDVQPKNLQAKTLAVASDISFAGGGALVLAGALFYFMAPSPSPQSRPTTAIDVMPFVGPTSASLVARGVW